jgi:hypothetical protein
MVPAWRWPRGTSTRSGPARGGSLNRLSDLHILHSKSRLDGAFVWARGALSSLFRGFRPGQYENTADNCQHGVVSSEICCASSSGMLTQGGQGDRAAPLTCRSTRIPAHFPLKMHGI